MATLAEITKKVNDARESQKYEKTFDLERSFVAEAGKADSFTIPLTNEGPFIQESYNILCTKNSTVTVKPDPDDPSTWVTKNFCGVKLKFKSQAAGNSQSSDFVPVQLIGTPCFDDSPRYGARPFFYFYPKGDALIIEYDNRAPDSLNGEEYTMADEKIDIVFNGKIYPLNY